MKGCCYVVFCTSLNNISFVNTSRSDIITFFKKMLINKVMLDANGIRG